MDKNTKKPQTKNIIWNCGLYCPRTNEVNALIVTCTEGKPFCLNHSISTAPYKKYKGLCVTLCITGSHDIGQIIKMIYDIDNSIKDVWINLFKNILSSIIIGINRNI